MKQDKNYTTALITGLFVWVIAATVLINYLIPEGIL